MILISWCIIGLVAASASEVTGVEEHLKLAKQFLIQGNYDDAISHYDSAIGINPNDYTTHFLRAAVYLNIGRNSMAIKDLTTCLSLKEDYHAARFQRGKLYLMEGSLDSAVEDLRQYRSHNPNDESVIEQLAKAEEASATWKSANDAIEKKDHSNAVSHLSALLSIAPLNLEWRLARGDAYLELGDTEMAIGDYSRYVKIHPDSTSIYIRLAKLHLALGELSESLSHLKQCMRLDPDQKDCKKQLKQLRKLDKAIQSIKIKVDSNRWLDVLSGLFNDKVLSDVEKISGGALKKQVYQWACYGHAKLKKNEEAENWCSKVLEMDSGDFEALVSRAESRLNREEYDEAMSDFRKAHEINSQDRRVVEGYQKAEQLKRRAGMRDYYKILEVSRDATQKEIKKAYRRMAQQWHPDKYSGELPRDKVEKKMSEINAAYEVLSNEDLRRRYDAGDDPNDPTAQARGQGGNPFHGQPFFFQGGGFPGGFPGGAQFTFHF